MKEKGPSRPAVAVGLAVHQVGTVSRINRVGSDSSWMLRTAAIRRAASTFEHRPRMVAAGRSSTTLGPL
jgi:hypothetical protein